jgi:DNA-binding CsgD family transcriptional regulator
MTDVVVDSGRNRRSVLDAAESLGQLARWEWTFEDPVLVWSDNMFRMFGLAPGEITPTLDYTLAHTHPDDRPHLRSAISEARATGRPAATDFRFIRPGGFVASLRAVPAVDEWRDGKPYRVVGWVRDLTAERSADRELAARMAVTEAMASCSSFDDGAPLLLAALAEAMDAAVCVLWLRQPGVLVPALTWTGGGVDPGEFVAATRLARLRRGADLPGLAWKDECPITAETADGAAQTRRSRAAERDGLHGRLAFPAANAGTVLAIVELAAQTALPMTDRLARSVTAIGYEIGHFLARRPPAVEDVALTPRQTEVLQLAAVGLSARASADQLGVAPATVLAHLANIYERLRVTQKTTAIAEARRLGLLS